MIKACDDNNKLMKENQCVLIQNAKVVYYVNTNSVMINTYFSTSDYSLLFVSYQTQGGVEPFVKSIFLKRVLVFDAPYLTSVLANRFGSGFGMP